MSTVQEDMGVEDPRPGPARRIGFAIALTFFGLLIAFLSPLPFVVLGWFLEEAATHRVHETAFGMIFVLSTFGLLAQVRKPAAKLAQLWQMAIPVWLVILAILLIGDPLDPTILLFLVLPAVVFALHPGRAALLRPPRNPSRMLAALTLAAAVPLLVFAVDQFRTGQEASKVAGGVVEDLPDDATDEQVERALRNAGDTPDEDEAALHFGHWSAMAAYAVTIICLAGLASLRIPGWRVPAWGAGIAAAFYGAASLYAPDDASAAFTIWAILAIAWGLAFIFVAESAAREPEVRSSRADGPREPISPETSS